VDIQPSFIGSKACGSCIVSSIKEVVVRCIQIIFKYILKFEQHQNIMINVYVFERYKWV
jgi:hypothetical protein